MSMSQENSGFGAFVYHGDTGSFYRHDVLPAGSDVSLYKLQEDLLPLVDSTFFMYGYSEKQQTLDYIPFPYARHVASSTYRGLLDRPYELGKVSAAYSIGALNERQLASFNIALQNKSANGIAKINAFGESGDLEYYLQETSRPNDLKNASILQLDEASMRALLVDFLCQAGTPPHEISELATIPELLTSLSDRSKRLISDNSGEYTWSYIDADRTEAGTGKLGIKQQTMRDSKRRVERGTIIITSAQALEYDEGKPLKDRSFVTTKLTLETGSTYPKATVHAGIGNISTRQLHPITRSRLILGTVEQYREPADFSRAMLNCLGRVASFDSPQIARAV